MCFFLCIKKCCSLILLIIAILISSFLGLIFNISLFYYYQWLKALPIELYITVGIILGYLISLIFSSILLYKIINAGRGGLRSIRFPCTQNCLSLTFAFFLFMDGGLSVCRISFYLAYKYELNIEMEISPEPNLAFFIVEHFFPLASLNLWISFCNFNIEQKCCEGCCCYKKTHTHDDSNNTDNTIITINNGNKNTSDTNLTGNNNNKPAESINYIELSFHITTGEKIKIKAPNDIAVAELSNYFFEIMKIDEAQRNSIIFLQGGNSYGADSSIIIGNKFKSEYPIIVVDQNDIIHPVEHSFIYQKK